MSKNNLPAFPTTINREIVRGMTLRDYFAAKALQGLLVQEYFQNEAFKVVAEEAYKFSDAMLTARDKE
jgi:hypothetical protein